MATQALLFALVGVLGAFVKSEQLQEGDLYKIWFFCGTIIFLENLYNACMSKA